MDSNSGTQVDGSASSITSLTKILIAKLDTVWPNSGDTNVRIYGVSRNCGNNVMIVYSGFIIL